MGEIKKFEKEDILVKTKLKIGFMLFIAIFSTIGVIISMVGSIVGDWGIVGKYYFLFLTNQTNLLVSIYYITKSISYKYKPDLYQRLSSIHWHGAITSYIMLVFIVVVLLLGPIQIQHLVHGDGIGAVPPGLGNSGNFHMAVVENVFVHCLTPLFVFGDYLTSKFDSKDLETITLKSQFVMWSLYPLVYSGIVLIVGLTTKIYPYSIIDINYWGWWVVAFVAIIVGLYIFLQFYLIHRMKYSYYKKKANS